MKQKSFYIIAALAAAFSLFLSSCSVQEQAGIDYTAAENWAYRELDKPAEADLFFICPTVYSGDEAAPNMPLEDEEALEAFIGATNMEKGIYDADTRFFAPYYRQAGLFAYTLPEEDREEYLGAAYSDVKAAFSTYLDEYNEDMPIILAGFSQGADMCIRLLKDFFDDESLQDRLVACYAIGWRLTEDDLESFPHLKPAEGEGDTGVIVSFNTEDPAVTDSLIVPAGSKTFGINPLNWKTDSTPADKSLNAGACFTNYSGEIENEIIALTGAYLDEQRGTLKVTDISPEDYPPGLDIFDDGVYHLYDYQFFYKNLQQNVSTRLNNYISAHGSQNTAEQ